MTQINNPYRKGRKAGEEYLAAFEAYRQAGLKADDRPSAPANPYPKPDWRKRASANCGYIQWENGWRDARRFYEARRRAGK